MTVEVVNSGKRRCYKHFFDDKVSRNINISLMQQYFTYFFLQKMLKVLCQ